MKKNFRVILPIILVGLLLLSMAAGYILTQTNQDTRQQASGDPTITSLSLSPPTNSTLMVGKKSQIAIKVQIANLKEVVGVQYIAQIAGVIPSDLVFTPATVAGLQLSVNKLENTTSGKKLSVIFTTQPPATLKGAGEEITLGYIEFTPAALGNMTITPDPNLTKIVEFSTNTSLLAGIPQVQYAFANPTATPTPTPSPTPTPYPAEVSATMIKVQAENYDFGKYLDKTTGNTVDTVSNTYRSEDVDIKATAGTTNQYVIGHFQTGEWMQYTVTVPANFANIPLNIALRYASTADARKLHFEIDGQVLPIFSFAKTGTYTTPQTLIFPGLTLTAGTHTIRVVNDQEFFDLDWFALTTEAITAPGYIPTPSPTPTPTPSPTPIPSPTPYPAEVSATMIKMQAENYDPGKFFDKTVGNTVDTISNTYRTDDVDIKAIAGTTNQYVVGHFQTGEWMEYTVTVPTTFANIPLNIAVQYGTTADARKIHFEIDGVALPSVTLPKTGAYSTLQSVISTGKTLTAGTHTIRVVNDQEFFDLDWFALTKENVGTSAVVSTSPTSTPTLRPAATATPTPSPSPTPFPVCSADINKDGIVDSSDYSLLLKYYFADTSSCVVK